MVVVAVVGHTHVVDEMSDVATGQWYTHFTFAAATSAFATAATTGRREGCGWGDKVDEG